MPCRAKVFKLRVSDFKFSKINPKPVANFVRLAKVFSKCNDFSWQAGAAFASNLLEPVMNL